MIKKNCQYCETLLILMVHTSNAEENVKKKLIHVYIFEYIHKHVCLCVCEKA